MVYRRSNMACTGSPYPFAFIVPIRFLFFDKLPAIKYGLFQISGLSLPQSQD